MAEQNNWMEFTRFVPGFDFLKGLVPSGLAGAAAQPATPPSAFQQWLAPTMDEAEVQKRIDELKVVQFWLEQNGRALEATIQALEVQKMTLSTLKNMNAGAQQMANAFTEGVKETSQRSAQAFQPPPAAEAAPEATAPSEAVTDDALNTQYMQAQAMQWWGALTEQFQTIANKALEDIGQNIAAAGQAVHANAMGAAEPQAATPPVVKKTRAASAATQKKRSGTTTSGTKSRAIKTATASTTPRRSASTRATKTNKPQK